jgi:hypothetical protein
LFDPENTKHTQIRTVSLIREKLWDKAGWSGTFFLVTIDHSDAPVLAPLFKDEDSAREIFRQWRGELGIVDKKEQLRVTIVRGINRKRPHTYRIAIGSNPDVGLSNSNTRYAFFLTRFQTMEPSSSENLDRFLESYKVLRKYFFAPAVMANDPSKPPRILDEFIIKREIFIRDAWQISKNDIDSAAIQSDDDPIIPTEEKNPPVVELLRLKRK